MKKKILLALLLVAIFTCLFAVAVSANDEFQSIEFKVMLEGETEYTTVYTVSSTDYWNPGISMANKFYTDVERTVEFDKSNIVKIDLRNTVVHSLDESESPVKTKYITRLSGDGNNPYTKVTHFYMPAKVSAIPNYMFKNWTSLEFVDFGEATQIHDYAFQGCAFTEITIPAQFTHFRNGAFYGCTNLQSATILGDGATFGSSIFEGCTSLTSVTLTNPTTISVGMFKNCSSMTSYTIPETVTKVGAVAFVGTSITSIHFPANVTEIGYEMANGLTTLKTITFAPNSNFTKIGHMAFINSGLIGDIVLPEGLTEIAYQAFMGTKITSINLPSTLTTVGTNAFASTSVTEAIIPDSLTSIPANMYNGCKSLTTVSIPAGFTKIGEKAFQSCNAITSLTFRGNAGENAVIDTAAFESCYTIGVVSIPEGVTTLNNCAFNASGITHLTLPSTLTTVNGNSTFNVWGQGNITADYKLKSVTGLENTQISTIVYAMFRGQSKWAPEMITLPNTVTKIDTYAFADVAMKNISLGAGLKTLNSEAFTACMSLKNVYVPGTITSHADNSFYTRGFFFFVTSSDMDYVNAFGAKVGVSKFVSIDDYKKNPDNYKADKWVIYGCNVCETFYKGECAPATELRYDFSGEDYITSYCSYAGCTRCPKAVETKVVDALFTSRGYSTFEDSFMYDIQINAKAIEEYKAFVGKDKEVKINYGLVVSGDKSLTKLLDNEGKEVDNVIKMSFDSTNYSKLQIKFNNITDTSIAIHACAYVIVDGQVSYIGNGTTADVSTAVSFEDVQDMENQDDGTGSDTTVTA